MRLTYEQVVEAKILKDKGVYIRNLAEIYGTTEMLMARYIRALERYGQSFWTDNPKEKHDD